MAIVFYSEDQENNTTIHNFYGVRSEYLIRAVKDLKDLFEEDNVDFFFSIENISTPFNEIKVPNYSFAGNKRNVIIRSDLNLIYKKEDDDKTMDNLFNFNKYSREDYIKNLTLFLKYRNIQLVLSKYRH